MIPADLLGLLFIPEPTYHFHLFWRHFLEITIELLREAGARYRQKLAKRLVLLVVL